MNGMYRMKHSILYILSKEPTRRQIMAFTEEEISYLNSTFLGRIATVGPDGQPDAAPVGYQFDGTYLYVGGLDNPSTRKYRNVQAGNQKVALVVDDVVSMQPYTPRFLRIYGIAEIV